MPKIIKNVTDMEIDEISLVDRGANQHALVTIAKRASDEEENMPEIDLYNDKGELLDEEQLENGAVVYDEDGNAYEYTLQDLADEQEKELETVGKNQNPFLEKQKVSKKSGYAAQVLEELSKAYSDDERDAVLSKAFGRFEELEGKLTKYEELAKSERDLRLTREYISKAAEYNVPVDAAELGPVLYRMAETMSYDDCKVIAKCLEASGEMLFEEYGNLGGGDNRDIMSEVNARAVEIGKSDPDTISGIFDESPEAYDQYLRERA